MTRIAGVLRLLSVACLGLFAGAQLTEGLVLVPYWRSLPPADFLAWYAANDRRLLAFFGPLTSATALLAVAAAGASVAVGHRGRGGAVVAAVLSAVVVAMFFLYFQEANASFAAGRIGPGDVPAALRRWAEWHWTRTALAVAALAAALLSVRPPMGDAGRPLWERREARHG